MKHPINIIKIPWCFPSFGARIGTLVAQIHQAEKESLTKSAEAASLEVALQDRIMGRWERFSELL
jgi:hypothetical protein